MPGNPKLETEGQTCGTLLGSRAAQCVFSSMLVQCGRNCLFIEPKLGWIITRVRFLQQKACGTMNKPTFISFDSLNYPRQQTFRLEVMTRHFWIEIHRNTYSWASTRLRYLKANLAGSFSLSGLHFTAIAVLVLRNSLQYNRGSESIPYCLQGLPQGPTDGNMHTTGALTIRIRFWGPLH